MPYVYRIGPRQFKESMLQKQSNKVRHTTALFLTNYVSFCVSSRSPKRMSLFNIGQIGLVLVKMTLFGHGKV